MRNRSFLALAACAALLVTLPAPVARAQAPATWVNVSRSEGPSTIPAAVYDAAGTLQVAWADNPAFPGSFDENVYYSRSIDGGATFAEPRQIVRDARARGSITEVRIASSPTGATVLAWWDLVPDANGDNDKTAFVSRSDDGGVTFGPAVATSIAFPEKISAKEGFSNTSSLSVAFAPDDEIYLAATVMDYRFGGNVYFAKSTGDGGFTRPKRVSDYTVVIPRATSSCMAVLPSGAIWISWTEGLGDFFDEIKTVYYVTSTNGGASFSNPARASGAKGAVGAAVSLGGGKIGLLAQVQPVPNRKTKTNFFISNDGGKTFSRRARVVTTTGYSHLHQNSLVAAPDGTIAVAWIENAPRLPFYKGLFVAVSGDGGASFGEPVRLDTRDYSDAPSVVVAPDGAVGVVTTSPDPSFADREVVFSPVVVP